MTSIIQLSMHSEKSLLRQAIKILKKEGEELSRVLPNGTQVRYVRGANFDDRGYGDKFSLYKEVIKSDKTRYITNANVIRDEVYVNEIFCIKPEDLEKAPNYTAYASYVYSMSPGFDSIPKIELFNSMRRYPNELKKLLINKTSEDKSCSLLKDYKIKKDSNITKKQELPKIKGDYSCPEDVPKFENLEKLPTEPVHNIEKNWDDVVIEDSYVPQYPAPNEFLPKPIKNVQDKTLFIKPDFDDVVID